MDKYGYADFGRYYTGSWVINPTTSKMAQVTGVNEDNEALLSDGHRVPLTQLDWSNVSTPRLGYRHLSGGKYLAYFSRNAGRRIEKGLHSAAVSIAVPREITRVKSVIGVATGHPRLGEWVEQISSPTFEPVQSAVEKLLNIRDAYGFALDYSWAVCVNEGKLWPLALLFTGNCVASGDGGTWEWTSKVAKKEWSARNAENC